MTTIDEKINEIRTKLISSDISVLNQSLRLINELLDKEIDRGESALKKINTLFALGGIISALTLFFGQNIMNITTGSFIILIYLIYLAIVLLLFKTIYYLIKPIKIKQEHRISPPTVYEIQSLDEKDALRYEIAHKIWEFYERIPSNTENLFWFNRGQRNLIYAFSSFLILGALFLLNTKLVINYPHSAEWIIGIIFILFALFCDIILDKFGFWIYEEQPPKNEK